MQADSLLSEQQGSHGLWAIMMHQCRFIKYPLLIMREAMRARGVIYKNLFILVVLSWSYRGLIGVSSGEYRIPPTLIILYIPVGGIKKGVL